MKHKRFLRLGSCHLFAVSVLLCLQGAAEDYSKLPSRRTLAMTYEALCAAYYPSSTGSILEHFQRMEKEVPGYLPVVACVAAVSSKVTNSGSLETELFVRLKRVYDKNPRYIAPELALAVENIVEEHENKKKRLAAAPEAPTDEQLEISPGCRWPFVGEISTLPEIVLSPAGEVLFERPWQDLGGRSCSVTDLQVIFEIVMEHPERIGEFYECIRQLKDMSDPKVQETLLRLLCDRTIASFGNSVIVQALTDCGAAIIPKVVDALLAMPNYEEYSVTLGAVWLLLRLNAGDPETLAALKEFCERQINPFHKAYVQHAIDTLQGARPEG